MDTPILGSALALTISLLGYRQGALSRSGAIGATLVGSVIIWSGGWLWGWLLVLFFASSSLLSRFHLADKAAIQAHFAKGGRRDLGQVLANGGLGAALAIAAAATGWGWLFPAYLGVLATVNADTWATELGVLSRRPPRLITTGQTVPAGTSGGVTALGMGASLLGGTTIGLAAWGWEQIAPAHLPAAVWWPAWAALAGLAGSLCDSLLGATVQGIFYCERCQKETERAVHSCGARTLPRRGWQWLNNDGVNFLSSLVGGLVAMLIALGWR